MLLNKKRYMFITLTLILSVVLLSFNFKSVDSIDNSSEQEYKQYVLTWIDQFVRIQEENPLIFNIDTKYLDNNREAIQKRIRTLNNFNYPLEKVPDQYKDLHNELLQTIDVYKVVYENLYLAITSGDSKAVGENVGILYNSDIVLNRIKNTLSR